MRNTLLSLLTIALCSCASIPLGTMLRLATFDIEDLQTVNPSEIRAAVRTHHEVSFGGAQLSVKVTLNETMPPHIDESFDLEQLPDYAARGLGLRTPPEDRHWLVFKVRDEDVDRFRNMQDALVEMEGIEGEKSLSLGVGTRDSEFPQGMNEIPFAVDLRLFEADGFFTLIKETDIEIDRDQESP